MTCWKCMKNKAVWRTRDDRKVCRVCARNLKKERCRKMLERRLKEKVA